ncbi:hypothetical protein [Cupriavidus sp.]|uniref:hypothetical protein n=1 Tax=Cupriavidus sp. TaxID=1873897 RepID=UPI0025BD8F68|nr:hypothetical protein [Cupriavidus sp.]MCA3183933.1 hypothetical protein [Cupriavidus sp.]MCA3193576.1 hypothetical protein [Cupriavidus sp.]MCA3199966.1 hypothetical protein [Cupriavidus sp.]MCA3201979.1 hypothetical protein [Cupriavidus sp.]MCA3233931.1 hypothetical protein [Cupriavidus sp.]
MVSKAMIATGNPFVLALQDALGLPKTTQWFELRCAVDEAVVVRCAYLPRADGVEGFDARPLIAEYRLVPASAVTLGDPAEAFGDELDGTDPIPRAMPARQSAVSPAAVGWGIFGMVCAGAALSYALGLWP